METTITYEHVFNVAGNGVIAMDGEGHIAFINKQAKIILGFVKKKTVGAYISDVLSVTGPLVIKCIETEKP